MPDPVWDPSGKARAALASIVSDFGARALSSPSILDNVLRDLLPDSPKQVSLIVAAGGSTVAASLREHVTQGMDADTAVRLASTQLSEQTPYDAAGCRWVTAEFARALGYQVSDAPAGAAAPAPAGVGVIPPSDAVALPSIMPDAPVAPAVAPLRPDQAPTVLPPAQAPAAQAPPPQGLPPQGLPIQPAAPPWEVAAQAAVAHAGPPRRRGRKIPILIAIVVVVIGGLAIIGAVDKTPAAAPAALRKLLPSGTSQCTSNFTTFKGLHGVRAKLGCNENAIDGAVFAYQFNSSADYRAGLTAFNKAEGFDSSKASSGCPTKTLADSGMTTWSNKLYPSTSGQVLECFAVTFATSASTLQPSYVWTAPSENAIFQAVGGKTTSMKAVNTWWGNHGGPFDK